ncbi:Retrovirus-related Pol polyprotein, partial [Mucuna pruriens]
MVHQGFAKDSNIQTIIFETHYRQYEYVVMLFGITNSLVIFMDYMNKISTFSLIVYSRNNKEHEEHLKAMLGVLKEKKLYAKLSKCKFWFEKVNFLGHMISIDGIVVEPTKMKTML